MLFTSWLVLAVGAAATNSGDAFVSQCNDFVNHIHIKNITVTDAAYVAAGSNVTIAGTPVDCGPPFAIVPSDICRVAMKAATGKNGTVRFELWLPRNYSSRFFSAGNGGLGGCKYSSFIELVG
jgi:feruloyl esterase